MVQSKRKKLGHEIEQQLPATEHRQISTPNEYSNTQPDHTESDTTRDDRPIALRKGVRSCRNHCLCNFVSYPRLSLGFQTFDTN